MDCASCAKLLEMDLEDAGINAKCSWVKQTLEVAESDNIDKIKAVVKNSGYKITE